MKCRDNELVGKESDQIFGEEKEAERGEKFIISERERKRDPETALNYKWEEEKDLKIEIGERQRFCWLTEFEIFDQKKRWERF